ATDADLRHPRARRCAERREGDRNGQRALRIHPALPCAQRIESLLDGTRHGPRVLSLKGVRGAAHGGSAVAADRMGPVRAARGYSLPTPRAWLVRENKWRAARYGIDAAIVVDEAGTTVPLRDAIAELVEDLMPVAVRLDCTDELRGAVDVMERGPSYIRQREVVAGGGSLRDVVDSLVEELRTDRPASR